MRGAPPDYAPPIEDYAVIGDCQTAAMVSRDGSIDWLCLPRLDGGACFARLLGTPDNGRWQIGPTDPDARATRRYLPCTMVLETTFETALGAVTLTDFMPPGSDNRHIIRIVRGVRGEVAMSTHITLRFDYGQSAPWVTHLEGEHGIRAIAGPDMIVLRTPVELHGRDMSSVSDFTVAQGQTVAFAFTHVESHRPIPDAPDAEAMLADTIAYWQEWSGRCTYEGEWRDVICRSLAVLKLLTYAPTGGIAAAVTTSLPEELGGVRNWDYRYCWLRDASLTLMTMLHGGYTTEARDWGMWLQRAVAGSPAGMQIMYGLAGERRLAEWEVSWLPGYQGAAPVRVGNAASEQLQIDVYGEVMEAFYQGERAGLHPDESTHGLQRMLLARLKDLWKLPDQGLWESRGPARHYTFSKVMAWLAFDRAVRSAEEFDMHGDVEMWREQRDLIRALVLDKGFDRKRNTFTQYFGGTALDASLLSIPLIGFLPPNDDRVRGTVAAIEKDLVVDGFVLRYHTDNEGADGLPAGEGVFLACSFWLCDNLVLQGRRDDARRMFERLIGLANDVGLLSEEYDPRTKRLVGNFPQAFSHIGLVNTAFNLRESREGDTQSAIRS